MKQGFEIICTTSEWTERTMLKELKKDMKKTSFGGGKGTYACQAKVTIIVEKLKEPKKQDRMYYPD